MKTCCSQKNGRTQFGPNPEMMDEEFEKILRY